MGLALASLYFKQMTLPMILRHGTPVQRRQRPVFSSERYSAIEVPNGPILGPKHLDLTDLPGNLMRNVAGLGRRPCKACP